MAILVAALLLGVPSLSLALDPSLPLRQMVADSWQTADGLPQNSATSIVQTPDGYVWAATEEGLARFDGVRFEVFDGEGVPEFGTNLVDVLYLGRGGALWIGTAEALVRMEGGRFTAYGRSLGLPRGAVRAITEDGAGTVWVGTEVGGIASLQGGRLVPAKPGDGPADDNIRALLATRDGSVWAGTAGGLRRLRGNEQTTYRAAEGLPNPFVTSLWEARNGDLLIGTNGGGLARFSGERFTVYGVREGLPVPTVLSVREDRDGSVWAGTNGGGLCRLAGARFECLTTADGLPGDLVFTLAEDSEGGLWTGTTGGGIGRLREGRFLTWGKKEGLSSDVVLPVLEDAAGGVWIGTAGGGLNRLAGGRVTVFGPREGLPNSVALSLARGAPGELWIGTAGGGLTHYDGRRFVTLTTRDGLGSDLVQAIAVSPDGTVWAGTNGGGVSAVKDGRITTLRSRDGLGSENVFALLVGRDGTVWVGTSAGLSRIAGGRASSVEAPGLTGRTVLALYETDDGVLWAGTMGGGLVRVSNGRAVAIRRKDGLFDDLVGAILEDAAGNFWMSCNKGVFRARRSDLEAFAAGRVRSVTSVSYGLRDGLRTVECNGGFTPSAWRGSDGRLWFPTGRGLSVVDPARLDRGGVRPLVRIEAVLVDGRPVEVGKSVAVGAGSRNLEIRFTAPSFEAPRSVRFRYRLGGFDEEWVEAGTRRAAYFTNLPPGRYTFRVGAQDAEGGWNGQGAAIDLTVAARFRQTATFYSLCLACLAAAAFAAHRLRLRKGEQRERDHVRAQANLEDLVAERTSQLKAANEELEAFAFSVSHDLRAPLRAIEGFSAMVVKNHSGSLDSEGQRLLGVVRENARRMSRLIDDLLNLSRTGRAEIHRGRLDMEAMARAAFAEATLDPAVRARIDFRLGELPGAEGDASLVRQVWINLLTNAVKFTGRTERPVVEVSGAVEGGFARYQVRDNGAGFDMTYSGKLFGAFQRLHGVTEFEGTGIGLALVGRIVKRHGGRVSARGEVGTGATFTFELPVAPPGPEAGAPPGREAK